MDERNRPTLAQQLRQATAQAPRQQKALAAFATFTELMHLFQSEKN